MWEHLFQKLSMHWSDLFCMPISPQLSIGGHENIAYKTTYKFNSESNHYSSASFSIPPKCDSLYDTQVPKTQDD